MLKFDRGYHGKEDGKVILRLHKIRKKRGQALTLDLVFANIYRPMLSFLNNSVLIRH